MLPSEIISAPGLTLDKMIKSVLLYIRWPERTCELIILLVSKSGSSGVGGDANFDGSVFVAFP